MVVYIFCHWHIVPDDPRVISFCLLSNIYRFNRFVILFSRMSTRVLLATLSIPITPERTDIARLLDMDGIIVEKQRRLATLLGLQAPPTRIGLINDMVGTCVTFLELWTKLGSGFIVPDEILGVLMRGQILRTGVVGQHCVHLRWFVSSGWAGFKPDVGDETWASSEGQYGPCHSVREEWWAGRFMASFGGL